MTFHYLKKITTALNPVKNRIIQRCLYWLYYILRRRLHVNFISAPDLIIFSGNYFTIYWETTGCYKIVINDSIVLPGHITRVHFDSRHAPEELKIRFYGYGETAEKTVLVNMIYAGLKKELALYSEPDQFKAVLFNLPLKGFTVHRLKYVNPFLPAIPGLSIHPLPVLRAGNTFLKTKNMPTPNLQAEPFNPEHFKP